MEPWIIELWTTRFLWMVGGGAVALMFGAGIAILPSYPNEDDPNQGADIGGLLALIGFGAIALAVGVVGLVGIFTIELFHWLVGFFL